MKRLHASGPATGLDLPSLDAIGALPAHLLPAVALELAALQVAIASRWASAATARDDGPDRLLTVQEAAARLRMSADWVYRHADRLPFTRRQGRRALRFSERGLTRYLADRGLDSESMSI